MMKKSRHIIFLFAFVLLGIMIFIPACSKKETNDTPLTEVKKDEDKSQDSAVTQTENKDPETNPENSPVTDGNQPGKEEQDIDNTEKKENTDIDQDIDNKENTETDQNIDKEENTDPEQNTENEENADPEQNTENEENTEPEQNTENEENTEQEQNIENEENKEPEQNAENEENADPEQNTDNEENTGTDKNTVKEEEPDLDKVSDNEDNTDIENNTDNEKKAVTDKNTKKEDKGKNNDKENPEQKDNKETKESSDKNIDKEENTAKEKDSGKGNKEEKNNNKDNEDVTDKNKVDESKDKDKTEKKDKKDKEDTGKQAAYDQVKSALKKLENSTDIPTVCVYTKNNAEVLSRTDYVDCRVYTINCEKQYKLLGDMAGIRVRGNSTAYYGNVAKIRANQVPYRIKFKSKTNMFGLNSGAECKSWVLVKAEDDLLKNDIAFRLGRTIIHDYNYCSDGMLVHAYLNGQYKGIYELCEQCQVNKHRVNIYETPEGYKGTDTGYFIEIDNYGEKPCFRIDYGGVAVTDIKGVRKTIKGAFYSVKSDTYSDEQVAYAKKLITNTFKVLYEACEKQKYYFLDENLDLVKAGKKRLNQTDENGNLKDPAEIVVDSVLNIEAAADLYLVYEMAKDCDVGEGSFYMYADHSKESTDKRLTFSCPWDFEWAYGGSAEEPYAAVFNSESFAKTFEERSNPWFIILMKQDWFVKAVSKRWAEVRKKPGKGQNDPISQCMIEEQEMLNTYRTDLKKSGSVAAADSLISWVNRRIKYFDRWFLNG